MKSIFCTVTNDLVYDQRMNRICASLVAAGYDVTLVGRERPFSKPLSEKVFKQARLKCWFDKGKLFYAEYNIRLFLFLMGKKIDIICGIDLDTILPAHFISRMKGIPMVYDAHEYFTEMEEIVRRPLVHKAWKWIERFTVPKVKYGYTVSNGYAGLFREKYGVEFEIVRNATVLKELPERTATEPYILYQGAVNEGRGLEETIQAMQHIDCQLYICGLGDVYEKLQQLVQELGLTEKVIFHGYVEPDKLKSFTINATIGLTIFTNKGLSNQYSLANRFFDYFHGGVPQIAMEYPEYVDFCKKYEVAELIPAVEVEHIVAAARKLLEDKQRYQVLAANCLEARKFNNWQEEAKKLQRLYAQIPD